jgi:arginyl-tRNA synthetase
MGMAIQVLGYSKEKLHILIMQMVKLIKNGEEFKMSKRSGNSITLDDLIESIGKDPARWYMVSQSIDTHLEIDVDKALSKNNDNPYYYVQYAHARINQILKKLEVEKPNTFDKLTNITERELINQLQYFKPTINNIAHNYEVNKIILYMVNLAKLFHSYYANNKVINENDPILTAQRYYLAKAIKQVLRNGLQLLGIDAVNEM